MQYFLDRIGHLRGSLREGALAGLASPRQLHDAGQNVAHGASGQRHSVSPASPRRPFPRAAVEPGPCCSDGRGTEPAHSLPCSIAYGRTNKEQGRRRPYLSNVRLRTIAAGGIGPRPQRVEQDLQNTFCRRQQRPRQVPVEGLIDAVNTVLKREDKTLATYGPRQRPAVIARLREFLTQSSSATPALTASPTTSDRPPARCRRLTSSTRPCSLAAIP